MVSSGAHAVGGKAHLAYVPHSPVLTLQATVRDSTRLQPVVRHCQKDPKHPRGLVILG